MSISLRFEKHNAVITAVAPCKYVSPQIQWPGRTTQGERKQEGESYVANEERDGTVQCVSSDVKADGKKEDRRFPDCRMVLLRPPWSQLLHLCNFGLGPCFLIATLCVCVCVQAAENKIQIPKLP